MRSAERLSAFGRWGLSVLFATLIVSGLLGMHTLSTGHADHSFGSVDHGIHSAMSSTDSLDAAPALSAGCAECGPQSEHSALAVACVLALLVVVWFIARTGAGMLRARGPNVSAIVPRPPDARLLRPPSLWELSISRT